MKKFILLLLFFAVKNNFSQTASAFKYLDINRVKAGIANGGDMHWDLFGTGNASYEVPKGSNTHAGFASSLWIGGLDAGAQLHTACQTYRQSGNDFWPGPLDTTNATTNSGTVINYDKIWKVDYNDINTFITQFNLGNVPLSYTPTPDILNWPASGTGNYSRNLAPYVDVNNNGIYDPMAGGDYPKIKGDQALYCIFNDKYGTHGETGGQPLGVEIHLMAYSYACPIMLAGRNELAYTTFYDYKIINRSFSAYNNVYVGLWTDVDLGNYNNDYIGTSVQDNLGFCYNSAPTDPNGSGVNGYGNYPPAVGMTVLKGPLAPSADMIDNDNDGVIDEAGEEIQMSKFMYYNNNISTFPPATTNPSLAMHYYGYLTGYWKDGSSLTCGGNGYGGSTTTNYAFPWSNYSGNPCGTWTELSAGNLAGDRRYIISSGPFSFAPQSEIEFEYANVWSVDSSASSNIHIASTNKLIADVQKVRNFYATSSGNCLQSINVGISENISDGSFSVYPNPAYSVLNIKSEEGLGKSVISVTDILGKAVLEIKNDTLYNQTLNIESLNSGIYFLNIKSEKGQGVKKFVKQ